MVYVFETYFVTYIGPCGAVGTKSASVISMQIHFNLGILGMGGRRRPSLRTFYNVVKKLARFEFPNFFFILTYFINGCECFNVKQKTTNFKKKVLGHPRIRFLYFQNL